MRLRTGTFQLHSKQWSSWLIDCDAFDDESVATAARLLAHKVGPFTNVGMPPSHEGSVVYRLYEEMVKYVLPGDKTRICIVDDVYTTGGSLTEVIEGEWLARGPNISFVAAVLVSRAPSTPDWVYPLLEIKA